MCTRVACSQTCSCSFPRTFQLAGDIPRCPCIPWMDLLVCWGAWGGSGRAGSAFPGSHGSAGLSWHSPSSKCFVCAGLFFLRAELVWALLIVLPQPPSGLRTLRASSAFAYGSQQEFCHCPWRFLLKGSVFIMPCAPFPFAAYPECAGHAFPADRLPINPGCALSSCACIYRQEEAELIQGNSCFSHI